MSGLEVRSASTHLSGDDEGDTREGQAEVVSPREDRDTSPEQSDKNSEAGTYLPQPSTTARPASDTTPNVIYEWMKDISSRVTTLEGESGSQKKEDTKINDETSQNQAIKTQPKIRDCNWEQFKNRFSSEECTFAVETLLSGEDLDGEIDDEQLRRLPLKRRREYLKENPPKPRRRPQSEKKSESRRMERVRINSPAILSLLGKVTGETWSEGPHTFLKPFKILIHFHEKLEEEFRKLHERFGEMGIRPEPLVPQHPRSYDAMSNQASEHGGILHPSKQNPTHSGTDISKGQEAPQHQVSSQGDASTNPPRPRTNDGRDGVIVEDEHRTAGSSGKHPSPWMETTNEFDYEEIKCYIEFARSRLIPTYHMFDNVDHSHRAKIRFADLWSLFRLGGLVFERDASEMNSSSVMEFDLSTMGRPKEPRLWRVCFIWGPTVDWGVDDLESDNDGVRHTEVDKDDDEFIVSAYYIDFNGVSYSGLRKRWNIPWFKGEKEITELEIYPTRFRKDAETIVKNLEEKGTRFRELLKHSHLAVEHDGWTLSHHPFGDPITDISLQRHPAEYINSTAIIDFREALQMHPNWKPSFVHYHKVPFEPNTEYDEFSIIQWTDHSRSKVIKRTREVVIDNDHVASLECNGFLDGDEFVADATVRPVETDATKQKLTPDDLALLPSRIFVYSFRNRKFVNADVRNVRRPKAMPDPFNDLKIPQDNKRLIKSIVQDHFDKKTVERELQTQGLELLYQDFIRGKGKGLVILLHGAPGVGKTATAEAVAYAHRKPLFSITCGDLGIEPTGVERTLSEVFRLANLWDCVLLLDEAEIFLSHREKKDDNLQRNALVSIFLRTLEYYPGILFLTTNRVGALDEAVGSRVHVSIYFDHLDRSQTREIFKTNIDRSEKIAQQRADITKEPLLDIKRDEILDFALDSFKECKREDKNSPWWNGRQIRNAFQIATSLAYARAKSSTDNSERYLGQEHFEQVLKAVQEYEQYRQDMFQKKDSEMAAQREERATITFQPSRRESRSFEPGSSLRGSRPAPHQHASFPSMSSSTRTPSGRTPEARLPAHRGRDFTPSPFGRERPFSPGYSSEAGAPVNRSSSHDPYDDRETDDY